MRPCPFCSSTMIGIDHFYNVRTGKTSYWMVCTECEAEGPAADSEIDAERLWDTRSE